MDAVSQPPTCKLYKRRWVMLALYMFYASTSFMQWFQYSIIADVLVKFYKVSLYEVTETSMACFILYIILFIPGVYILEKLGVRRSLLLAAVVNLAGGLLRIATATPDKYWLLLLSQLITGSVQVIVQPIPPKLAAAWFGPNEISKACSAGVIGIQIGEVLGMLYTPLILNGKQSFSKMQEGFTTVAYSVAGISVLNSIIIFLFYQENPPTPPSHAQMKIETVSSFSKMWNSCRVIFANKEYILIAIVCTLNGGLLIMILTLLNQIVLHYYPDTTYDAGFVGVLFTVSGIFGSVVSGSILDKYRCYKLSAVIALTVSFLAMTALTFLASRGLLVLYVLAVILGVAMRAMTTITYEAAAEVTYPEPISIPSGILTTAPIAISALFDCAYSKLFYNFGDVYANLAVSSLLLVALILMLCARVDLKRYNA